MFRRIVYEVVDNKRIPMLNEHGFFTAEYVAAIKGITYKSYKEVPDNLFTKTECSRMLKPIKKNEKPIAFRKVIYGYAGYYKRNCVGVKKQRSVGNK